MIKPNYPKKHKCKICGTEISNRNYQQHFKKNHNISKDEYFKRHLPFIFKTTVRGISKKEIRSFFKKIDAVLSNEKEPKDERSKRFRQARQKLREMSKTISGMKFILNNWDIISQKNWTNIHALLFVWNNDSKEEILKKIQWLEENKHKSQSPEYMRVYRGEEWYENYMKRASERVKGENNPGFNHGGRLSAWSRNFKKYQSEDDYKSGLEKVRKKSKKTKSEHPENECTKLEYWLARYPEDEARRLYRERQATFSLKKCIERYGEEEGRRRWAERQEKWLKTLDSKPIEEKEDINRRKCGGGACVSKAERKFVELLEKELGEKLTTQHPIVYGKNNSFVYDIVRGNKIIEYFGDFWHANPKIYDETFVNRVSKLTYHQIHERDEKRIRIAKEHNYDILIVWESDFKSNPEATVRKCLDFLRTNP